MRYFKVIEESISLSLVKLEPGEYPLGLLYLKLKEELKGSISMSIIWRVV